jgi:hypothetical protein
LFVKGWAEDLPPTKHLGTESPATSQWQSLPSTPVKNMKRNASYMQESSDSLEISPSQKRVKLIEAAMAEKGSSDHSGPSLTSPNAIVNEARNISALQPSPSGSQPFFSLLCFLNRCHSRVKCQSGVLFSSDINKVRHNTCHLFVSGAF